MQLIVIVVPYVKAIKINYFTNDFKPQPTAVFIGTPFYKTLE